jgi:hypothetical protein
MRESGAIPARELPAAAEALRRPGVDLHNALREQALAARVDGKAAHKAQPATSDGRKRTGRGRRRRDGRGRLLDVKG